MVGYTLPTPVAFNRRGRTPLDLFLWYGPVTGHRPPCSHSSTRACHHCRRCRAKTPCCRRWLRSDAPTLSLPRAGATFSVADAIPDFGVRVYPPPVICSALLAAPNLEEWLCSTLLREPLLRPRSSNTIHLSLFRLLTRLRVVRSCRARPVGRASPFTFQPEEWLCSTLVRELLLEPRSCNIYM